MTTISIGFHDVVDAAQDSCPAGHASVYTLERRLFRNHLLAIKSLAGAQSACRVDQISSAGRRRVFLTVDDGKASAITYVAPDLEDFGWNGHFFVTTNMIGQRGFLNRQQIRELHQRGHLIGSHSCSHPEQMSWLGWHELLREWGDSCALLGGLVGEAITVASVPGGYYSHKVGESAAASGIKVLFTSEPTFAAQVVDGCLVLGRYSVRRSTPPTVVGALAAGEQWPLWEQAAIWSLTKTAKKVTGRWYSPIRQVMLDWFSH